MSDNYLKNFSYITLSRVISTVLQAGFYLIFAFLLDPEVYGEITYWIAIAGTVSILSRIGLSQTVVVYQAQHNPEKVARANIFAIFTTGVASIGLLFVNIPVAILCMSLSLFTMHRQNLLGSKNYKKYFWTICVKSVLIIGIPILLYFMFEIPGILIGMALGNFLAGVNFLKYLKPNLFSFRFIFTEYKTLINNLGVESSLGITRWIDKLLIVPLFGFFIVGIYQFNLQILFALSLLPLSLHSFLLSEESSGISHKKLNYLILSGSVILVLLSIVLAPYIIPELFPKYSEGIESLQILIIALIPFTFIAIFSAKLQAKESTKVGIASLVRICSLLILIAIFGTWYGLIGLSLSVLLSTIFETIFLVYLYKKHNK